MKKEQKKDILTHARSEFRSIVDTFDIANIFLQSLPDDLILNDKTKEAGKKRSYCKGVFKGLKNEIEAMKETINLFEGCFEKA